MIASSQQIQVLVCPFCGCTDFSIDIIGNDTNPTLSCTECGKTSEPGQMTFSEFRKEMLDFFEYELLHADNYAKNEILAMTDAEDPADFLATFKHMGYEDQRELYLMRNPII